jgi:hypothetical protein
MQPSAGGNDQARARQVHHHEKLVEGIRRVVERGVRVLVLTLGVEIQEQRLQCDGVVLGAYRGLELALGAGALSER